MYRVEGKLFTILLHGFIFRLFNFHKAMCLRNFILIQPPMPNIFSVVVSTIISSLSIVCQDSSQSSKRKEQGPLKIFFSKTNRKKKVDLGDISTKLTEDRRRFHHVASNLARRKGRKNEKYLVASNLARRKMKNT